MLQLLRISNLAIARPMSSVGFHSFAGPMLKTATEKPKSTKKPAAKTTKKPQKEVKAKKAEPAKPKKTKKGMLIQLARVCIWSNKCGFRYMFNILENSLLLKKS